MSVDFDTLIDEASAAHVEESFCLDGDLQARREQLSREAMSAVKANEADARLGMGSRVVEAAEELKALTAEMRERTVVVRFTAMSGAEWRQLKLKNKPRSQADKQQGYNTEAAAIEFAASNAVRVLDDGSVEEYDHAKWLKFFNALSGGDQERFIYAVIGLNQLSGQQIVASLVKG